MKIFMSGNLLQEEEFVDTIHYSDLVQKIVLNKIRNGYPFCQIDSITREGVWIHEGPKTETSIDSIVLVSSGLVQSPNIKNHHKWIRWKLNQLGQHGFPFAKISLHPTSVEDHDEIHAYLKVDAGPHIVWDSIHFVRPVKTNRSFLNQLLDIEPGEAFSEDDYLVISKKIGRFSFLSESSEPDLSFTSGKATPYLDIEEVSSNSFEGVLGVLSNQASSSKPILTGFINLHLENLFLSGKSLDLKWNRYAIQSQTLELSAGYPFPLGTSLLFDFGFGLIKQDSSFLNQLYNLSLSTFIGSNTSFLFGFRKLNGSLIEVNEANPKPGLADFTTNQYKIGLDHNKYQSPFTFSEGIKAYGTFHIGRKRIRTNPSLPESFYDSLAPKSTTFHLDLAFKGQKIISKRGTFFQSVSLAGVSNPDLFENELYRIGGLRTLRGFNENSFYARNYLINQLEWRQYFESRSYFLLFYDQAWIHTLANKNQYPSGLGFGFSLATNGGLLNFVMATGSNHFTQINLADIKVHIGYQAIF